ncbi:peptidase domain-containing ABC transporter [Flammeovirga aprica]|uniref:Peptidase domain-containing ABC transporter n=1 Tax=Flammeovirga aprica JL-4 TaxID=694437 RepID=A0A7X9XD99_9BACT|nr:peptidase domain-containing ABC transporter [Flammeovirga aprica]NME72419.1 peptidase domain-containing ABC transporter [Flammeovirga aprica JL-4]
MKQSYKTFEKYQVMQQGESDCGVACLLSIINYYDASPISLEELRAYSGTTVTGTSMLGLYEAAQKIGFKANGCKATLQSLKEHQQPAILHVIINQQLQHYIVFYQYNQHNNTFVIGDPARGVKEYTEEQLLEIWTSKTVLVLEKTPQLKTESETKENRKKWFLEIIEKDKNYLISGGFIGVVIAVLGLSMSIFSQRLIDHILPSNDKVKLLLSVGLLCVLLGGRVLFTYIRGLLLSKHSKRFNSDVIHSFFSKLMYLPVPFFQQRKTGEMVARLNDTQRLQQVVTHFMTNITIDVLLVLISLIYLCFFNIWIGVAVLVIIPVYVLVAFKYNTTIMDAQQEVMELYAQTESQYISTVQGIKAVKINKKESYFTDQTKLIYDQFQARIFDFSKLQLKVSSLMESWNVVFSILLIGIGAYFVFQEQLTTGEMMAILTVAMNISPSVIRVSLSNIEWNEAKVVFDRMYEFVKIEKEKATTDVVINDIKEIEFIGSSFRFPGKKELLSKLNFKVEKGEIIALTGESGSGKSTILNLLQKFQFASSGEIKVDGHQLNEISNESWRQHIGVVDQDIILFSGTVIENITMSQKPEDFEEAVKICQEIGLHDLIMKLPQNYMTVVGENGVNLSGGQKQLIAFARAMIKKPKVLLLDEFTSAMDSTIEKEVLQIVKKDAKHRITIVISHHNEMLQYVGRMYKIENNTMRSFAVV